MVGHGRSRELCEALELAPSTLQADHFRFLSTNHSRPHAATIKTTITLHGVDEVGSSLGVVACSLDELAGFDAVALIADDFGGVLFAPADERARICFSASTAAS